MKAIKCEMCGSGEIVKTDGYFVCQNCGTKYTVEEAKKMMIEGTVKIDHSDEMANYYILARRARKENNYERAVKYYNLVLENDPSQWEASFYSVYFKHLDCGINDIFNSATALNNCLPNVLQIIKEKITSSSERYPIIQEIYKKVVYFSTIMINATKNYYRSIPKILRNISVKQLYVNNCFSVKDLLLNFGNLLIKNFNELYCVEFVAPLWEIAISNYVKLIPYLAKKSTNKKIIKEYAYKIKKYNPSYKMPHIPILGFIYVYFNIL